MVYLYGDIRLVGATRISIGVLGTWVINDKYGCWLLVGYPYTYSILLVCV